MRWRKSMNRAATSPSVDRAFDRFLQAPIDEDRHERVLSVLSALARLDLDPWTEAAALADLPTDAAIQRLAALIHTLPDSSAVPRDAAGIATRLVARLPSSRPVPGDSEEQAGAADGHRASPGPERPTWRSGSLMTVALVFAVIVLAISMLTGRPPQALFGSSEPSPGSAAAASLKVAPKPAPSPATPIDAKGK